MFTPGLEMDFISAEKIVNFMQCAMTKHRFLVLLGCFSLVCQSKLFESFISDQLMDFFV